MSHKQRRQRSIWASVLTAAVVVGALYAPQLGKQAHAQGDDEPPAESYQALKAIWCDLDGCRVIGYWCLKRCWAVPCCADA